MGGRSIQSMEMEGLEESPHRSTLYTSSLLTWLAATNLINSAELHQHSESNYKSSTTPVQLVRGQAASEIGKHSVGMLLVMDWGFLNHSLTVLVKQRRFIMTTRGCIYHSTRQNNKHPTITASTNYIVSRFRGLSTRLITRPNLIIFETCLQLLVQKLPSS